MKNLLIFLLVVGLGAFAFWEYKNAEALQVELDAEKQKVAELTSQMVRLHAAQRPGGSPPPGAWMWEKPRQPLLQR